MFKVKFSSMNSLIRGSIFDLSFYFTWIIIHPVIGQLCHRFFERRFIFHFHKQINIPMRGLDIKYFLRVIIIFVFIHCTQTLSRITFACWHDGHVLCHIRTWRPIYVGLLRPLSPQRLMEARLWLKVKEHSENFHLGKK